MLFNSGICLRICFIYFIRQSDIDFQNHGNLQDQEEMNIADNPLYHDTWKLLKKYRDVVWRKE